MASRDHSGYFEDAKLALLPESVRIRLIGLAHELVGLVFVGIAIFLTLCFVTYSPSDPSFNTVTNNPTANVFGTTGAAIADIAIQFLGNASYLLALPFCVWGLSLLLRSTWQSNLRVTILKCLTWIAMIVAACVLLASLSTNPNGELRVSSGGLLGDALAGLAIHHLRLWNIEQASALAALSSGLIAFTSGAFVHGVRLTSWQEMRSSAAVLRDGMTRFGHAMGRTLEWSRKILTPPNEETRARLAFISVLKSRTGETEYEEDEENEEPFEEDTEPDEADLASTRIIRKPKRKKRTSKREAREEQPMLELEPDGDYHLPALSLLTKPKRQEGTANIADESLEQNAKLLETVLDDFGVRGEIIGVRPGPVVTLYELEPAAGIKSSRVIGLADDIARSMSAVAARVAVVPGRNVIGIELPNSTRETVFLREMLASPQYEKSSSKLALALGKDIGGEPVMADLAKMPHLLIAGTTGSGKSVGINAMILSILYRLTPQQCKMIMIDPKMLELSVYEGIPHLISPVVTDAKKAVVALKWLVKEMEDRYRKMSKVGVRNITGYNERMNEAMKVGEVITRTVQTGFDKETGQPIYENEEIPLEQMPLIVVVVDEVADLMMDSNNRKATEAAIQRLAQMARAAGIHLITATQRPSVDVITGTIKANLPTRISFQVTSKIDSRTILGEMGAEQLLGQGDMLYMAVGGRIQRLHGPFVSDDEVEKVVKFLKKQGAPDYIEDVTESVDGDEINEILGLPTTNSGDELYDQAVAIVARDGKASTSYVQRRLQIGYNRAARIIEKMEEEGVVSQPNHSGKREVLVGNH